MYVCDSIFKHILLARTYMLQLHVEPKITGGHWNPIFRAFSLRWPTKISSWTHSNTQVANSTTLSSIHWKEGHLTVFVYKSPSYTTIEDAIFGLVVFFCSGLELGYVVACTRVHTCMYVHTYIYTYMYEPSC